MDRMFIIIGRHISISQNIPKMKELLRDLASPLSLELFYYSLVKYLVRILW